ncbi:3-oxoacyl-reductase [Nemania serpens]|nr:3-oxoacyl-reductase [Nemania serpens]
MTPPPRLEGKVAIVTGGASGFGKGIATKFVQEGAKVLIADLSEAAGQAAGKELGCAFTVADVTKREDWERILKESVEKFGKLDIVVNNAGAAYVNKATEDVTDADFDLVMNVNVKSVYLSTNVVVPYFVEKKIAGNFIQIASTAGVRPRPRLTWYNASKAAVIIATKTMAVEYGPQQIRLNSVSPVVGSTGMTHLFIGKPDTPENRKAFESLIPLGRGSTPADVANACCYLASDEAAFITGVNLEVDGGRCV